MKRQIMLWYILLPMATNGYGQNLLANNSLVDLRGQVSTTVLTNHTNDTLKLEIANYYYTPYYETEARLSIAPGGTDSLKISLAFPSFIILSNYNLLLYNAPGRRIHAMISGIRRGTGQIEFAGDLIQENNYYMAYQNNFKGTDHEHRPYYAEASKLTDLNAFPPLADSINNIALSYLQKYRGPLPSYFKAFEESRLNYNAAYRKYNVLLDREFRGGKQVSVNPSYFDFEKSLSLNPDKFILNNSYMDYAGFLVFFKSGKSASMVTILELLDRLTTPSELSDALKMNMLLRLFKESRAQYDIVFPKLAFYDERSKHAADSIIRLKNTVPLVGMLSPPIKLAGIQGDTVSLKDFKGKPVIINFWASWCAPCLKALPYENSHHDKYSAKGLTIVNICVDTDREKWKSISREKKLRMINLYATDDEYRRLKRLYNVESLPRSILIAKDGTVLNSYYKQAWLIKDEEIEELLKGR